MWIQKLADATSDLEKMRQQQAKAAPAPDVEAQLATADLDSWAEREEHLKKRAGEWDLESLHYRWKSHRCGSEDAAEEMKKMQASLQSMAETTQDSAETKAKVAQMEETIAALEADRWNQRKLTDFQRGFCVRLALRAQLKEAQENGGMAASEVEGAAALQELHDQLQKTQGGWWTTRYGGWTTRYRWSDE